MNKVINRKGMKAVTTANRKTQDEKVINSQFGNALKAISLNDLYSIIL